MKLFKILFISIISIFIFQSQIYGINLRCDFKKRLFDINKNQDNRVTCGWLWGKSYCEKKGCNICEVRDSRQEDSVLDGYWISEVVIKDEDVVIRYELSDFDRSRYTNKEKRDWREKQNRRVFKLENVVPSKNAFNYRNKMEFTFSNNRWVLPSEPEGVERDFALGMHIPKRWDKILNIDTCHLMPEIGTEILNKTQSLAKKLKLKPYDQKTHNGFLRYLLIRFGHFTGEIMVNLVSSYENPILLKPLVDGLIQEFPQITTVVNNINTRKADVAFGEYELHLHGKPYLEERLGGLTFEISANSFFQTNSVMAEKLYETALEGAELTGEEVVFDLYSGTGSVSLFLARKAKEVHGFEVIVSSVEDATRNAIRNGVGNAHFHVAT